MGFLKETDFSKSRLLKSLSTKHNGSYLSIKCSLWNSDVLEFFYRTFRRLYHWFRSWVMWLPNVWSRKKWLISLHHLWFRALIWPSEAPRRAPTCNISVRIDYRTARKKIPSRKFHSELIVIVLWKYKYMKIELCPALIKSLKMPMPRAIMHEEKYPEEFSQLFKMGHS